MKDKDLEKLLSEARNKQVSGFQLYKWKKAVNKELNRSKSNQYFWMQLAAASIVGFLVGGFVFGFNPSSVFENRFAKNEYNDATVEYVYTKIN